MTFRHPPREPTALGQESVWDYPRPPRLEPVARRVTVSFVGAEVARTERPVRVLETSHPPTYYLHPDDVRFDLLVPVDGSTWCEWKGEASYFDVVVGQRTAARAAWLYRSPTAPFAALASHVAFYPGLLECAVDGAAVVAQPGGFYGGWVTPDVAGPFKGEPGTSGW